MSLADSQSPARPAADRSLGSDISEYRDSGQGQRLRFRACASSLSTDKGYEIMNPLAERAIDPSVRARSTSEGSGASGAAGPGPACWRVDTPPW
jgi:hypothetical protein